MEELAANAVFAGYTIESVLGRGGMGVLYRAIEPGADRTVALKVFASEHADNADFRERFLRESRIAASIEHPHVVPVYRVDDADGRLFIATRLIRDGDLSALIAAEGRLDPARAARIVDQIADALDATHARDLVHRDVKPLNVLVEQRPRGEHVYLTAFGLTKDLMSTGGLSVPGAIMGTIGYAAPEQFENEPVSCRTDVYSLGCVLFKALTGRAPYDRKGAAAIMLAHISAPPPTVSDLVADASPEFDEIIARALAKEPAERYASADELGSAALAAAGLAAPARTGSTRTRARRAPSTEDAYREWLLSRYDRIHLAAVGGSDVSMQRLYVPLRLIRREDRPISLAATATEGRGPPQDAGALDTALHQSAPDWLTAGGLALRHRRDDGDGRLDRRVSLGELIREHRRSVVVGRAGVGKSTLIAWAAAGLAGREHVGDGEQYPDAAALPEDDLLPIVYKCGRLTEPPERIEDLWIPIIKRALPPAAQAGFLDHLLDRLHKGTAILFVDGLDELRAGRSVGQRDPLADREMMLELCARLGEFGLSYNQPPIIVTSRSSAYDELEGSLDWGFTRVELVEWSRADKEAFARRMGRLFWPGGPGEQRAPEWRLGELLDDEHYQELTSTPLMLANTAFLLSRPGGLPRRLVDVYAAAISALLKRRRGGVSDAEALPQLHYIAYWMLDRNSHQCSRRELEGALQTMRDELSDESAHPAHRFREVRRAVTRRPAGDFVDLLVNDTDVLTVTGEQEVRGVPVTFYGFHHPTFKEFLAGRAIANDQYPSAGQAAGFAQHLTLLAERLTLPRSGNQAVIRIGDPWVDAVRTAVACFDEDVDVALAAIGGHSREPEPGDASRPQAVLAALCLAAAEADRVSDPVAAEVLDRFIAQIDAKIDGQGMSTPTSVDAAAVELAASPWAGELCTRLVAQMRRMDIESLEAIGGVSAMVSAYEVPDDPEAVRGWLAERDAELCSGDTAAVVSAALAVMFAAYRGHPVRKEETCRQLVELLTGETVIAWAVSWALYWFMDANLAYRLDDGQRALMVSLCEDRLTHVAVRQRLLTVLGSIGDKSALDIARRSLGGADPPDEAALLRRASVRVIGTLRPGDGYELVHGLLQDPNLQSGAAWALGRLGDSRAIPLLIEALRHSGDERVRTNCAHSLGMLLVPADRDDGQATGDAITALIACLKDDSSPRVRGSCALALGQAGTGTALPHLAESLAHDRQLGVRVQAAAALSVLGGATAVAALRDALRDPSVRATAAGALADMENAHASDVLLAEVASGETDLIDEAARSARFADQARFVESLEGMADRANPEAVRAAAGRLAGVLAALTRDDDPAAAKRIMKRLAADSEGYVRIAAFASVPVDEEWFAYEALAPLADDDDVRVRRLVVRHLSYIADERAVAVLTGAIADSDVTVVTDALAALRHRQALPPRESLRPLLTDARVEIRLALIGVIAPAPVDDDVELLVRAADDPDASVQREAVGGLLRWLGGNATRQLEAALQGSEQSNRERIVDALRRDDDGVAVGTLLQRILSTDERVHLAAASALGRIAGPRFDSAAALLDEPTSYLTETAVWSVHPGPTGDPVPSIEQLAVRVFIILFHDLEDASGLARLLDDLREPASQPAIFTAPPVRNLEFFTDAGAQTQLDQWWAETVPPGAIPVYVIMQPDGLRDAAWGLAGEFIIGVSAAEASEEFTDIPNSTIFVAGGPLDFATMVMMEFSEEAPGRPVLFDRDEAHRMAALASDFPLYDDPTEQ